MFSSCHLIYIRARWWTESTHIHYYCFLWVLLCIYIYISLVVHHRVVYVCVRHEYLYIKQYTRLNEEIPLSIVWLFSTTYENRTAEVAQVEHQCSIGTMPNILARTIEKGEFQSRRGTDIVSQNGLFLHTSTCCLSINAQNIATQQCFAVAVNAAFRSSGIWTIGFQRVNFI